jgi:hypothetical protein
MKEFFFVLCIFLFFGNVVFSQVDTPPYINKNFEKDVRQLFVDKYQEIAFGMRDSCFETCIYLKFQIDDSGRIKQLFTSYSQFPTIDSFLLQTFRETDGKWKPRIINGKAVVSKLYVLPLFFELFNSKCGSRNYTIIGVKNILTDNRTIKTETLTQWNFYHAFPQKCVILNPITFMSPFVH